MMLFMFGVGGVILIFLFFHLMRSLCSPDVESIVLTIRSLILDIVIVIFVAVTVLDSTKLNQPKGTIS
jgi:hypothetical protein